MTSPNCIQRFLFFSSAGREHNTTALILPPGCLTGHFSSISHDAVWRDVLLLLHHTVILITAPQSRRLNLDYIYFLLTWNVFKGHMELFFQLCIHFTSNMILSYEYSVHGTCYLLAIFSIINSRCWWRFILGYFFWLCFSPLLCFFGLLITLAKFQISIWGVIFLGYLSVKG